MTLEAIDPTLLRPSGISAVGDLPWGSHFCHLYREPIDLIETLVPYFKAGLEANEQCCWVTSDPLGAEEAKAAFTAAYPSAVTALASGQLDIIDYRDWYVDKWARTAPSVIDGWLHREQRALALGFAGLRITGNTYWLAPCSWDSFAEYERSVNRVFKQRAILALCSYSTHQCDCDRVLDIVAAHDFALARRHGHWQVIEHSSLKFAKEQLLQLNSELELRVQQRTEALRNALVERDMLLREVNHRVKNNLQIINSVLNLQAALSHNPEVHQLLRDTRSRTIALAVAYNATASARQPGAVDVRGLLSALASALLDIHDPTRDRMTVELDMERPVASTDQATPLAMLLTEILTNALKHAFPGGRHGIVQLGARRTANALTISINDNGIGFDPETSEPRLGRQIISGLVVDLNATLDISTRPGQGTFVQLTIPDVAGETAFDTVERVA